MGHRVSQKGNPGIGKEFFRLGFTADIFVIAKNRIDGNADAGEFCSVIAFHQGPELDIHDISPEKHQIRLFGIDEVYPSGQFLPAVAVSQVQIAGQNNRKGPWKGFFRLNSQLLAVLVPVVDSAGNKDGGHHCKDAGHQITVIGEPFLGDEPDQYADIQQEKGHKQV